MTIDFTMAMSSTTVGQMRQQLGELGAALAVLGELELRPEQLRVRIDERGPIAFEQLGGRQRAIELGELRLVVEQLQMARRAGHEQEDDVLRPRPEMAAASAQADRRPRERRPCAGQLTERNRPQPDAALLARTSAGQASAAECCDRDGLGSSW